MPKIGRRFIRQRKNKRLHLRKVNHKFDLAEQIAKLKTNVKGNNNNGSVNELEGLKDFRSRGANIEKEVSLKMKRVKAFLNNIKREMTRKLFVRDICVIGVSNGKRR